MGKSGLPEMPKGHRLKGEGVYVRQANHVCPCYN